MQIFIRRSALFKKHFTNQADYDKILYVESV